MTNGDNKGRSLSGWVLGNEISLYRTWADMKTRCYNKKREKYRRYGGRGVSVCEEWMDSNCFFAWALENGYQQGLQIDRINNDGNYEPSNCRFVTQKENARNKGRTQLITLNGETKCVAEWCEIIPVSRFTVYWWIKTIGREYAEQRCEELRSRNEKKGE